LKISRKLQTLVNEKSHFASAKKVFWRKLLSYQFSATLKSSPSSATTIRTGFFISIATKMLILLISLIQVLRENLSQIGTISELVADLKIAQIWKTSTDCLITRKIISKMASSEMNRIKSWMRPETERSVRDYWESSVKISMLLRDLVILMLKKRHSLRGQKMSLALFTQITLNLIRKIKNINLHHQWYSMSRTRSRLQRKKRKKSRNPSRRRDRKSTKACFLHHNRMLTLCTIFSQLIIFYNNRIRNKMKSNNSNIKRL